MNASHPDLHLPPEWRDALARAGACRRVLVLGATDMGKTSFIRAFLDRAGGEARLIDLDPGQKMIGPPGTVARGRPERVERFVFVGTTSASALSAIAGAARALSDGAEPFIVNTSGFVKGIGARLQAMTVAAIEPDLIVELGIEPIATGTEVPIIRLERSPLARRKSPAARAALRQAAFDREWQGASTLPIEAAALQPGPLAPWESTARPVCSLADAQGDDLALGIVQGADGGALSVYTRASTAEVQLVRLGKMWAEPREAGWRLIERLSPSWIQG